MDGEFNVIRGDEPYEPPLPTPVEDAVRAELARLNVIDVVMGQTVIELAKSIDAGRQVPSCARELRGCMAVLRKTSEYVPVSDELDDLRAKREARRAAQGG